MMLTALSTAQAGWNMPWNNSNSYPAYRPAPYPYGVQFAPRAPIAMPTMPVIPNTMPTPITTPVVK